MSCDEVKNFHAVHLFRCWNFHFLTVRGLGGFAPYEQFLQIFLRGKSVKKVPVDVHRQCLLFLSRIIDKNSYHDFWVITTFRKKADKIRGFHQKSRDNFLQIFRKSENSSRKCRAKSRDNFFSETDIKSFFCDKVIKLFKPLMRYAPKSSSVNVSCKELSRLFTELISEKNREIFGNPQKVITTFL